MSAGMSSPESPRRPSRPVLLGSLFFLVIAPSACVGPIDYAENAQAGSEPVGSAASAIVSLNQVALGLPFDQDPSNDYLMDKSEYVLSYNPDKRVSNWVSWEVDMSWLGHERRSDHFDSDPDLPPQFIPVTSRDYWRSHYDRGHLCPSGDRTRDAYDNARTFLFTNIEPQTPSLNRGPWRELEERVREIVRDSSTHAYITAGPVFSYSDPTIGTGVAVPAAFFKVVVILDASLGPSDVTEDTEVIAVLMPNDPSVSGTHWTRYRVSVGDIEAATGYTFFSSVPEPARQALKARVGQY